MSLLHKLSLDMIDQQGSDERQQLLFQKYEVFLCFSRTNVVGFHPGD